MFTSFFFFLFFLNFFLVSIESTNLIGSYTNNKNLIIPESPYYITGNVAIQNSATFFVENGVEIIFNSNYIIDVMGNFYVGCLPNNIISNSQKIGLNDSNNYIYVHGNSNYYDTKIQIQTGNNANATFCNVLFENFSTAISSSVSCCGYGQIIVDNSEFKYFQNSVIGGSVYNKQIFIYDSHFHDLRIVDSVGYGRTYKHCLFEKFTDSAFNYYSSYYPNLEVYDSIIIGLGHNNSYSYYGSPQRCFAVQYGSMDIVQNVTFINCSIGIRGSVNSYFNTFINNNISIYLDSGSNGNNIYYGNNFMNNNNYYIVSLSNYDINFAYNYWGSIDAQIIRSKIVDICDGFSFSLINWSPYLLSLVLNIPENINVSDIQNNTIFNLPTMDANQLCVFDNIPNNVLLPLYTNDINLTLINSPYYVNSNVLIATTATVSIENGVEIIFTGNYIIKVRGNINACLSHNIQSHTNVIGLINSNQYIYIHNDVGVDNTSIYNQHYGSIHIDSSYHPTVQFCNTLFSGLQYGIYLDCCGTINVVIDNSEFSQIGSSAFYGSHDYNYISIFDTYFHDLSVADSTGWTRRYYNCLFKNFNTALSSYSSNYLRLEVYDSFIIGNNNNRSNSTNQICVSFQYSYSYSYFQNVTITNCDIAVRGMLNLNYCNLMNNNIAIKTQNDYFYGTPLYGNNFIDNNINILHQSSEDLNIPYNYWNTINPIDIAQKILDVCDGYSLGSVIWWPYLFKQVLEIPNSNFTENDTLTIDGNAACNIGGGNYNSTNPSILQSVYFNDLTLSLTHSPYYINNNVIFQASTTLFIENGVEIIFNGDYILDIRGNLNGCLLYNIQPYYPSNNIGLIDSNNFIHIHGVNNNNSNPNNNYYYNALGRIQISSNNKNVTFCNTLFESLKYALDVYSVGCCNAKIIIDNSEFRYMPSSVIYGKPSFNSIIIYDSNFHDLITIDGYGSGRSYYNCMFSNFRSYAFYYYSSSGNLRIYDSWIIGNNHNGSNSTNQICVSVQYAYADFFRNVTIRNCDIALRGLLNLYDCNFINNNIAIKTDNNYYSYNNDNPIYGNNFINNNINILHQYSYNLNVAYNYWSTIDEFLIAKKILDICDGYGPGLITFWPYLIYESMGVHRNFTEFEDFEVMTITNYQCSSSHNLTMTTSSPSYPTYSTTTYPTYSTSTTHYPSLSTTTRYPTNPGDTTTTQYPTYPSSTTTPYPSYPSNPTTPYPTSTTPYPTTTQQPTLSTDTTSTTTTQQPCPTCDCTTTSMPTQFPTIIPTFHKLVIKEVKCNNVLQGTVSNSDLHLYYFHLKGCMVDWITFNGWDTKIYIFDNNYNIIKVDNVSLALYRLDQINIHYVGITASNEAGIVSYSVKMTCSTAIPANTGCDNSAMGIISIESDNENLNNINKNNQSNDSNLSNNTLTILIAIIVFLALLVIIVIVGSIGCYYRTKQSKSIANRSVDLILDNMNDNHNNNNNHDNDDNGNIYKNEKNEEIKAADIMNNNDGFNDTQMVHAEDDKNNSIHDIQQSQEKEIELTLTYNVPMIDQNHKFNRNQSVPSIIENHEEF